MTIEEPKRLPMDELTAAFATAICDVVASEIGKLNAVIRMLQEKAGVSDLELERAYASFRDTSPEMAEAHSASLHSHLQKRIAIRYQQIMLLISPEGKPQ